MGYKFYVDMDGVLVDFISQLEIGLGFRMDKPRYAADPEYRKMMWKAVDAYEGALWADAAPLDIDLLKHLPNATILSSFGSRKRVIKQKMDWLAKHNITIDTILVSSGVKKARYACDRCVLIDDTPRVIEHWKSAGGIPILHTSLEATLREVETLIYGE